MYADGSACATEGFHGTHVECVFMVMSKGREFFMGIEGAGDGCAEMPGEAVVEEVSRD